MMREQSLQITPRLLRRICQPDAHHDETFKSVRSLLRCEVEPKGHACFQGLFEINHPGEVIGNLKLVVDRFELLFRWGIGIRAGDEGSPDWAADLDPFCSLLRRADQDEPLRQQRNPWRAGPGGAPRRFRSRLAQLEHRDLYL